MGLRGVLTVLATSLLFTIAGSAPSALAAHDDGYPPGQPAPGRTCPNSKVGQVAISPFNGKHFVCTMIDGTKRWWTPGVPLPKPSPPASPIHMPPSFKPSYLLPAAVLSTLTVHRDVAYGKASY